MSMIYICAAMIMLSFGCIILSGLFALAYFIKCKDYAMASIGVVLYMGLIGCVGLMYCI